MLTTTTWTTNIDYIQNIWELGRKGLGMLAPDDVCSILSLLVAQYRSLEHPSFFFVKDAVAQQPYQYLIAHIQQIFEVEEDTDLNVDVAFHYVLSSQQRQWSLQLSMLGSYATLWRILIPGELIEVIGPATNPVAPVELKLLHLLEQHGVRVLDEASLDIPVLLNPGYTSPADARLYHALFGDYDPLPWK